MVRCRLVPLPVSHFPPPQCATRPSGFRAAITVSWETTPQLVLGMIASIAMILPALVVRRLPSVKPAAIAATWAAIVLVISCINCVQVRPLLLPYYQWSRWPFDSLLFDARVFVPCFRPSDSECFSPSLLAAIAAIVFILVCINCVQLAPAFPKVLPPNDPETDVSAQYDNADQIFLLPLGYVSFLGYVTPRLVWLFLLCPLLMLLTGVGSAKTLKIFFPYGFVRCARGNRARKRRGGGFPEIPALVFFSRLNQKFLPSGCEVRFSGKSEGVPFLNRVRAVIEATVRWYSSPRFLGLERGLPGAGPLAPGS